MSERTVKHDTVVIERNFKASEVRVFAAWADPNAHGRWNVPGDDWEIADYDNDFRVGSREKNPSGRGVIRNIQRRARSGHRSGNK